MAKLTWDDIATEENIKEAKRISEERRSGAKTTTSTTTNNNQQKQSQTSNTTVNNTKNSTSSTASNNNKKLTWDDIATEENIREAKRVSAERRVVNNNATVGNTSNPISNNSVANSNKIFTQSEADAMRLKKQRSEIKDALSDARNRYLNDVFNPNYKDEATLEAEKSKKGAEIEALVKQLEEVELEITRNKYNGYLDDVYDDSFMGEFKANYALGRLSQDSNFAWNDYAKMRTDVNRSEAEHIDAVLKQFSENNAQALEDENWVSKSLAGYLPQAVDNVKGVAIPTVAGAAIGLLAGPAGALTGGKVGYVAGSTANSFNNMRGAELRNYLQAGVEEDIAHTAATEAAMAMAAVEGGEAAVDALSWGASKVVGKAITSEAVEKLLKSYGFNIFSEGLEEAVQEVISITALERAKRGETGTWELLVESVKKLGSLTPEEKEQVVDSGIEGSKLAVMLGGFTRASNYAVEQSVNAYNNKIYSQTGQELSDMEIVDDVIQSGLESAPETESHKLAQELQAKREAGVEISNAEVGRLHSENARAIREEEAMAQNKPENEAVAQVIDEGDKLAAEAPNVAENVAQEATRATVNNVEITDADRILNQLARERAEMLQQENEYNFYEAKKTLGKNGAKALENLYDSNTDFNKYYADFSTYYEAGNIGTPMDLIDDRYSREVTPKLKLAAYVAGQKDAEISLERDKANAKVYTAGEFISGTAPETVSEGTLSVLNSLAKSTGLKIRFADKVYNGKANGQYFNGEITIAKDAKKPFYVVAKHEVTHGLQVSAPVEYRAYRDYAVQLAEKTNGMSISVVEQYKLRAKEAGVHLTTEQAMDEIAADFTEKILKDGKTLEQFINENIIKSKSMLQKFFDAVHDFIKKVKDAFNGNRASMNKAAIEEFGLTIAELEKAEKLWLNALQTTHENVKKAQQNKVSEVTVESGNTHGQFSLKDSSQADEINNSIEAVGISYDAETESVAPRFSLKTWNEFDKKKAVKNIKKVLGVSEETAQEYINSVSGVAKYIADNKDRLDYSASESYTALKHNSEYIYTVDMTTLCKKRLLQTGTIDAIQKILSDKVLQGKDYLRIRQMLADAGYEVACGLCYVESRRKELDTMIEKFISEYNGGNHNFKIPDFATVEGIQRLMVENKDVYDAFVKFNNKRGSGKVNLVESRAEYKNEILKLSDATVKKLNDRGGLRAQSYSDFETPHLIDMMQVVLDMATKGLMSQAYTKVPNFADAMGKTGMKINLSLIAKGAGYDSKGRLLFDDKEGMPFKDAMRLRNKYSDNVGTILVGINDRHIELAMADDRIDYIIPYHRSGWAMSEYEVLGINGYEDYSATQNEKWKDPYVRDENGEIVLDNKGKPKKKPISNFYPHDYWDYSKTGDENAQIYLQLCEEHGKVPKFPQFAGKEGYWKLLIDFKMYDNDGVGVPQTTVKPLFDNEVNMRILEEYKDDLSVQPNKLPVAEDIVERFVAEYNSEGTNYSLKDTGDILKENAALKEYNEYLKSQMKLTKEVKVDKKALERLTRSLIKEYSSSIDSTELFNQLDKLYTYMQNTDQLVWEDVKEQAVEVARNIVSEAMVVNDELYQSYKSLRDHLRKTSLTLHESYRSDLPDGYNEFRRANFGRLNLVNDGMSVDSFYQELSDMYPEFFDAERYTHPAEQLQNIAEVLDSLRPYEDNPYRYNMTEAAEWVANDIIERYYDVPQTKATFADKQQKALEKQKMKDAQKLNKLRKEKNERIELIKQHSRDRVKNILKTERAKKKEAITKVKEHQRAKEARMSDKRKRSILRDKIIRHINPMKEKLLRPSDKNHIPQEMRLTVASLLDAINLESNYTYDPETGGYRKNDAGLPTRRTEEFRRLKEQYEAILKTDAGAEMVIDPSLFGVREEGIESNFDKVIAMSDVRLADMTLDQLNTVWEVLRAVEHSISSAGAMLSQQKYETTAAFAEAFQNDTSTRRGKKGALSKVALDLENPYTFFSHYGQAGKDFYRMLRNAQDYEQTIQSELAEKVQGVVSSEQRKQFEKELVEFTTINDDKLTLSKAHIMNIYLLSKRKQAEQHLLKGGIVQPEINRKIRRGTDAVRITEQDLIDLFANLSAEEKKIADEFQKLTLFLAEKGNETTMSVYGYEKFTDPNYWTIKSAKEGLLQTVEKGQDLARSIRNMGSAKQTVPNASNPLEIGSVFEVFDAHASEMITYSAWLAPMEDANRLFNFRFRDEFGNLNNKTMKGLLNRLGGENADSYWMNLMKDIQNGISSPSDDFMFGFIAKTIGNVKKAAVAGNIRVVVQQPTAYLRAAVVLSPDNMLLGLTSGATKGSGWKKAVKYAPIAARKEVGGFEVSASPKQLSETLYKPNTTKGKGVQFAKDLPTLGAAKADEITWGAIWNASEWQISKTRKEFEKGSESFYKAVAELFTDVVDQTQVVDGVLQRSQLMRSSNAFNKQATAFMGEPTLSLNLLLRNYDVWRNETTPQKRSAALKSLGQAAFVLMLSNVAVAIAQSSVDALRDDDEEKDYLERFMSALTGLQGDEETKFEIGKNILLNGNLGNAINLTTWIPYVKDGISVLQGFTVERMDAGVFSDFVSAVENAIKSFNGEGKWNAGYAAGKTITTGAKLFGSSAANVARDIESILRSVLIETENWTGLYEMEKQMYDVENQKSRFLDILYHAYKNGDRDSYDYLVQELIKEGISAKSIESGMRSRWKKDAEVSGEFNDLGEFEFGAGIEFKYEEEEEEPKFSIDNLTPEQYVDYSHQHSETVNDIIEEFNRRGFGSLDDETANKLLSAAYSYSEKTALEDASNGQYQVDVDWINNAKSGDLGLSIAEYIMFKEEYGSSALASDGILEAYEGGVEPEIYLEFNDKASELKADADENGEPISGSKKAKVIDLLLSMNLSDDESYQLYFSEYDSEGARKAQEYDIPADLYMEAVAEMQNIVADYNANGKAITNSRRKKVEQYLNSVCNNYREYLFLLGTEYSSVKKDDDYIMYFGKQED